MTQVAAQQIESTAGVRGGKPRISGTRITVADIVTWTEQGHSPDVIVADYPQLTLVGVHAALSHYYANQSEIDEETRESLQFAEELSTQLCGRIP